MAPRTRNSDKKRRPSHRREVHFPRRDIPVRKSGTVIRSQPNYENLILYYLTKLKRLFSNTEHPHPKGRENSADKMRREQLVEETKSKSSQLDINPNKYAASHTAPKPRPTDGEDDRDSVDSEIKEKVFNVVNAAIEYGFANNVLEKKGDCFVFRGNKKNSKIANRQPTPGPAAIKRSYCAHCTCSNCKTLNLSNDNTSLRAGQYIRPMSENNASRSNWYKNVNNSSLHESKTQHLLPLAGRSSRQVHKRSSRSKSCTVTANKMRRMCTCSKCRALEQRRKLQRK